MKVGELKSRLDELPDDCEIVGQLVGSDGKAWHMFLTITPVPRNDPLMAVITGKNSILETLIIEDVRMPEQ